MLLPIQINITNYSTPSVLVDDNEATWNQPEKSENEAKRDQDRGQDVSSKEKAFAEFSLKEHREGMKAFYVADAK